MHYDIMNPKLRYTDQSRRENLMSFTHGSSALSKKDMKAKLLAELRQSGIASTPYPNSFKMSGLIAQALQPVDRRISMYAYYQKWCEITGVPADGGASEWAADTTGVQYDPRV